MLRGIRCWFGSRGRKGNHVRLRVELLDERAVPACVDFFSTSEVSPIAGVGTAPSDPALVGIVGPDWRVPTSYDAMILKVIAGPQPEPPLV